ncbi:MAG: acyltransferase, partial [Nonomuraea sp.]|nr:acyltransferase [Nonomuraea sp.]
LVLLQAWVNDQSVNLSVNSVSWSLSCEAFFYACFPFIAVAALRVQRPRAALAVAAFGTWCVAGIVELSPFAPTTKLWLVYFFPPTRALEFVVGILACRLVLEGRAPRIRLTAAAAFATAAYLLAGNLPWRLDLAGYAAVTLIPFALVIVAATQRDVAGATPWLLRSNAAVTLGRWSFAFYLVHFTILTELADHLLSPTSSITSVVLVILLALGLSVAASGLLHELVERPVERRLRHGRRRVPEVA